MKPPAFPFMPVLPISLMASVVVTNILLLRRLKALDGRLARLAAP